MNVVSLSLFKKHVRADDFADDDDYLMFILASAEEAVITANNRTRTELEQLGDGDVHLPIKHAIMMLGAHWYNQRESVSSVQMHSVPDSLQSLIKPYRKLV